MDRIQVVRQILAYLDRTPIEGREAATMIVCQQWLKNVEQEARNPPATPSQVADTSGK